MNKDNRSNSTAYWQALDAAHHIHPQTTNKTLAAKGARVITKGEGIYVWDSEGRRLLDGMAGLWCVQLGYGNTELAGAAAEALAELPFYNTFFQTTHPRVAELTAKLATRTPEGIDKFLFHTSGSEATDAAAKIARFYWRARGYPERNIILSREKGYHGSTMAGASMSGIPYMHKQFGLPLPGFEHGPTAYQYRDGQAGETPEEFGKRAAQELETYILKLGPEKIAAFIAEPVQGAGGLIIPPPEYWPTVSAILKKHDILFIADEVVCGFGRTGAWFGSQTYGLAPDMMTLAKGLTCGYVPLSALALGPRIGTFLADLDEDLAHGMTYEGHPVGCAVALKTIEILERDQIIDRVRDDTGPYFQEAISSLSDHPVIGEVRGIGLLAGLELTSDKSTRARFDEKTEAGLKCRDFCFDNGLVMRSIDQTMVLAPPLIITRQEVDELVSLARKCLDLTADALL